LVDKKSPENLGKDSHSDEEITEILKLRKVAVIGISRDPTKASHYVPKYLKEHGYHIMPVNPFAQEILNLRCYRSLLDVEEPVDIVDVFRPSENVPSVIDEAIEKKVRIIWLQEGIHNPESEENAIRHGLGVIWNRCMMKEHARLYGGKPRISLSGR